MVANSRFTYTGCQLGMEEVDALLGASGAFRKYI